MQRAWKTVGWIVVLWVASVCRGEEDGVHVRLGEGEAIAEPAGLADCRNCRRADRPSRGWRWRCGPGPDVFGWWRCPSEEYCDDDARAGCAERVRLISSYSSNSVHYFGYYVGGGAPLLGRGRQVRREGTWGLDYMGLIPVTRVWLNWTCGRRQGGDRGYETDGPHLGHALKNARARLGRR